jgi:hypothetical protein
MRSALIDDQRRVDLAAERSRLAITTIGSVEVTMAERIVRRKLEARDRKDLARLPK